MERSLKTEKPRTLSLLKVYAVLSDGGDAFKHLPHCCY
jgi:hypothetical protein